MPKKSQPDPKNSAFNKDSESAVVADQQRHTRDYHNKAGDSTLSK